MVKRYCPLKRDYYVYALFRHDTGVVFYVGKGRGRRYKYSCNPKLAKAGRSWKENIILAAAADGKDVPVVLIHTGLLNAIACEYERALILAVGRHPNGPLVNQTDGGEGLDNPSAEIRAKKSAATIAMQHVINSPEACAKRSRTLMGHDTPQEVRDSISKTLTGRLHPSEVVKRRGAAIKARFARIPMRKPPLTEEHKGAISRGVLAARTLAPEKWEKFTRKNAVLSDGTKALMRAARKRWWELNHDKPRKERRRLKREPK
jgi:hypothetical protein